MAKVFPEYDPEQARVPIDICELTKDELYLCKTVIGSTEGSMMSSIILCVQLTEVFRERVAHRVMIMVPAHNPDFVGDPRTARCLDKSGNAFESTVVFFMLALKGR